MMMMISYIASYGRGTLRGVLNNNQEQSREEGSQTTNDSSCSVLDLPDLVAEGVAVNY
jgi:hypothetical protein